MQALTAENAATLGWLPTVRPTFNHSNLLSKQAVAHEALPPFQGMNRRAPTAANGCATAAAAAAVALYGSLLLLSACCVRRCEAFAPPLNHLSNGNSNHHLCTAAPASRAALAREARSGTCPLTSSRDRLQQRRATTRIVAAGVFSGLRTPAAASTAAGAAATEFEDPLGGVAPTAVLEGGEQEVAPKKKRKAAPRKKVRFFMCGSMLGTMMKNMIRTHACTHAESQRVLALIMISHVTPEGILGEKQLPAFAGSVARNF